MKKYTIFPALLTFLLSSCSFSPEDAADVSRTVPMYPDYTDITIPVNIAPLNFLLRDDVCGVKVFINGSRMARGRRSVRFSESRWRKMLYENADRDLNVTIYARYDDGWKKYPSFIWHVTSDRVDPYLTYRLIEPDYETFNKIVLQERNVENFRTTDFCDHRVIGNKCMNCHTYAAQDPATSMFYVRGKGGGAIFNDGGKLRKLTIKSEDMVSNSTYYGFSSSKRYVTFSTNRVIPGYQARAGKRMEVYDTESDVYVADMQTLTFIRSGLLSDPDVLETFPCFSPDGKYIYYCTAPAMDTTSCDRIENLKYSLCRIGFDEQTGEIGTQVDTVWNARLEGGSVCHPRISPDGKFICFSVADFGTFHLWHSEADLVLMNIETGEILLMDGANSARAESYHSWSGNSRWIVLASKRDDGMYGKPYFTHIDPDGKCSKAFVLPQKHPDFYDNLLKSFNAPEMGSGPLPFDAYDVQEALEQTPEPFRN